MTNTRLIIVTIIFVTFIASISIFSAIGKIVGELPQSTPIDVPNALRKMQQTDQTLASTNSASLATQSATPQSSQQ